MRRAPALLALLPAAAFGLWSGGPESICDLPASDDGREHLVRGRYVLHEHGVLLTDPSCPARMLHLKATLKLSEFEQAVDPEGKRFGIPLGAGTHTDIELHGKLDERGVFVVDRVDAYDRHDILDARWRVASIESSVGTSGWQTDEQFPFSANTRILKRPANRTVVHGTLNDAEVGALLKLSEADTGTFCQVSESAQSLVRLQCMWQGPRTIDQRSWVYAREGKTWRLVAKTDGVRL